MFGDYIGKMKATRSYLSHAAQFQNQKFKLSHKNETQSSKDLIGRFSKFEIRICS